MGSDVIKFDDKCLDFIVYMTSEDFFEDLEVEYSNKGAIFKKGRRRYTSFPEEIKIIVNAEVIACRLPGDRPDTILGPQFMKALQFEAFWKTGTELRPANSVELEWRQPGGEFGRKRWMFWITIKEKSVPLTDSLILHVFSKDGKLLARFAGRL